MASFIGKVHFLRFFLVEEQNWTECQRCPESIIEAGYGLSKEYTSKDFPKKLTCGVNCILKWVLFSTPFFLSRPQRPKNDRQIWLFQH